MAKSAVSNQVLRSVIVILIPCLILLFCFGQLLGLGLLDNHRFEVTGGLAISADGANNSKLIDVASESKPQLQLQQERGRPSSNPVVAIQARLRGAESTTGAAAALIPSNPSPTGIRFAPPVSTAVPVPAAAATVTAPIAAERTARPEIIGRAALAERPRIADSIAAQPDVATGARSEGERDALGFVLPPLPEGADRLLGTAAFSTGSDATVSTPPGLDSAHVVIGVWVYLEGQPSGELDQNMRTILSNKQTGCEPKDGMYGLSLYVNGWQTSDRRLYMEYGSEQSGCHKLMSVAGFSFPTQQWVHVAAMLQESVHLLFVNGKQVARKELLAQAGGAGGASSTGGLGAGAFPQHRVNGAAFTVGQYDYSQFPLHGRLRNLVFCSIPHDLPEGRVIDSLMQSLFTDTLGSIQTIIDRVSSITAFFPLDDSHKEVSGAAAKNVVQNHIREASGTRHFGDGVYRFPSSAVVGDKPYGLKMLLRDGLTSGSGSRQKQPPAVSEASQSRGRERADKIRSAVRSVWSNYKQYAWGKDELHPISLIGSDNWGGMGVTLVDSLDTLWILGLKKEFNEARDWVASKLTFSNAGTVSVFETTIRELGGLLSAYDLSGDRVFLEKAQELGDKLLPAFATSSGIASGQVDLRSGHTSNGWAGSSAILSEMGSLQIEFRNLAKYTGQAKYEENSMRGLQFMRPLMPKNGLLGIKIDITSGRAVDSTVTFGALGDSFYEYLLKVWIQGGKQEAWLRDMYDRAMQGVMDLLLATSDQTGLLFVADWNGHSQHRKMDHLVCFLPGILALGAHTDPLGPESERAMRDMAVAKALMFTCREMYRQQESGISPEYVEFPPGGDMTVGSSAPFYILRPETAESLFVLGQLTGEPIYKEWSWEIWEAIDRHCKLPHGYGPLRNVKAPKQGVDDRMESFFLAETVKYLFLAQDPDQGGVDLDKVVFNTEAHPTRIFTGHTPVQG